jgi:arginine N-succinyltransferase
MSFIVRSIRENDYDDLMALAKQFNLLNLPADPKTLKQKIKNSRQSFAGELEKEQAEYLFVLEDIEEQRVIGTCLILAKHGTEKYPHYYFKIFERKKQSPHLGVGFIHSVLSLGEDISGPTEIGGLMLDRSYRRQPKKLGQLLSLSRFVYMGLNPNAFEENILCELSPPLTDEGRSEFWEALGRRFTGMNYLEADRVSQQHKGFIKTLFPEDDIYLCLLDSSARLVIGEVAEETRGARHLLEKIGFSYKHEVDPFDGGPHYGCKLKDVSVVKKGKVLKAVEGSKKLQQEALLGYVEDGEFFCAHTFVSVDKDTVSVNLVGDSYLKQFLGKNVFCSLL